MVWVCFSYYRMGPLVFIDTKMDSAYYVNMLSSSLLAYSSTIGISDFVFVQNNDPKHTSRLTKEFFNENNINVEPWPPQSPECTQLRTSGA